MTKETSNVVHWSFWVISGIALIWNGLGSINFFVQMNPEVVEAYRASEQAIIVGRPAWATAGFGAAVLGGALGSLLLLLRNSAAWQVFIISLLGVVVAQIHTLGAGIDFGTGEILGIVAMPLVVALFLLWYTRLAARRNWIN